MDEHTIHKDTRIHGTAAHGNPRLINCCRDLALFHRNMPAHSAPAFRFSRNKPKP